MTFQLYLTDMASAEGAKPKAAGAVLVTISLESKKVDIIIILDFVNYPLN